MLRIPYIINLIILVPVVFTLLVQPDAMRSIFGPGLVDSPTLRPLVACLWLGVLACSFIALAMPARFWPLLVFQFVYKGAYLALHVIPVLVREGMGAVPGGVAATFTAIVLIWPFFIWQALQPDLRDA
jgi:hypothetical protein